MSDPKEYVIERIEDMLAVPQDKWPAMMEDVREWLEMRLHLQPLVELGLMQVEPHICWVDDDIRGLSSLTVEVVESFATPSPGAAGGGR